MNDEGKMELLSKESGKPKLGKLLPPCKVCGSQAAGFHYGVNTCDACKGFFHRSLNLHKKYICKKNETCQKMKGSKRMCRKCRYDRCVAAGMAKEAIKTGRYTASKHTSDTLEVQRLMMQKNLDVSTEWQSEIGDSSHCTVPAASIGSSKKNSDLADAEQCCGTSGFTSKCMQDLHNCSSYHRLREKDDGDSNFMLQCIDFLSKQDVKLPDSKAWTSCTEDNSPESSAEVPSCTPPSASKNCDQTQPLLSDQGDAANFSLLEESPSAPQSDSVPSESGHTPKHSMISEPFHSQPSQESTRLNLEYATGCRDSSPTDVDFTSTQVSPECTKTGLDSSKAHLESTVTLRLTDAEHMDTNCESATTGQEISLSQNRKTCTSMKRGATVSDEGLFENQCNLCGLPFNTASVEELYADKDQIIRVLEKASEKHLEPLVRQIKPEEMDRLAAEHLELCKVNAEMFGRRKKLPDSEYDDIYARTGIDADNRQEYYERWLHVMENLTRSTVKFAKAIPGFPQLPTSDKEKLIKSSLAEISYLNCYHHSRPDVCFSPDNHLRCLTDFTIHFDSFEEMHDVFYCSQNFSLSLQKLQLTRAEEAVLKAIVVMAPDRGVFTLGFLTYVIYLKLHECLIYLLRKNRPGNPMGFYTKILDSLVRGRTLTYRQALVMRKLNLPKYSQVLHNPLVLEVLTTLLFDDGEDVRYEESTIASSDSENGQAICEDVVALESGLISSTLNAILDQGDLISDTRSRTIVQDRCTKNCLQKI